MAVFKRKWRNNISFKKETEKIVLFQMKGSNLIQIIEKFRTLKYLCTFLSYNFFFSIFFIDKIPS